METCTATRTVINGIASIRLDRGPDAPAVKIGGKRAERAVAVIVVRRLPDDALTVWGCRSDLAAAYSEAHRIATATSRQTRFGEVPFRPMAEAHVVHVVDA
jgi:hypothetical protein